MHDDRHWMELAIDEAKRAPGHGDVPIGAVVVHNGAVIGRGHNRVEKTGFPFEHAEVVAMWDAIGNHGRRVLQDSRLYVTVEPCVMCAGAILLARVPRVVFGAREPRTGACESVFAIPNEPKLLQSFVCTGGVEADRCRRLIQEFFETQRRRDARAG